MFQQIIDPNCHLYESVDLDDSDLEQFDEEEEDEVWTEPEEVTYSIIFI